MKDEVEGKAKEIKGKLTGDKGEEMAGKAQQGMDKARRAGRDIRDDIKEKVNEGDEAEREKEAETVRERRSW
ncbi:MAG TPA: hypothetical protein VEU76_04275 [Candidatus Udaeobacter sp.]|nr:hypothetical protein [Candidatus Udaeobacter sp.]